MPDGQNGRDDGYGSGAQFVALLVCLPLVAFAALMCWVTLALFGAVAF